MSASGQVIGGMKSIFGIIFFSLKWFLIIGLILIGIIILYYSINSIINSFKERKTIKKFNQDIEKLENEE